MAIAVNNRRGVVLATMRNNEPIPEIGRATTALDRMWDIHFGINSDAFNDDLRAFKNQGQISDDEFEVLYGLGPRTLDIVKRGGRTAEDTWILLGNKGPVPDFYKRARQPSPDFDPYFETFNQGKKVRNEKFRPGAKISGHDVGGQRKYAKGARGKDETASTGLGGLQYGTRWSKTALEFALSSGHGKIHFHLDGMGDIHQIVSKDGNYTHNVTSRELRYVFRNWNRFKDKVHFYNGYDAANRVVRVQAPWLWREDHTALRCSKCNTTFWLLTRKHHCRACGKIFCSDCSSKTKIVPSPARRPGTGGETETGAVRVCDDCF